MHGGGLARGDSPSTITASVLSQSKLQQNSSPYTRKNGAAAVPNPSLIKASHGNTMTGFLSNRLTQIKSKAVNKAGNPETAAKLKVKSGKDSTQQTAANLFNISVTSFNKTQGAGGQAGAYSPTLINNPLVDRITPTTSTQLLSFYQQHHQLLKNQEKLSS